jgi:uncharacterized protein (TIGR03000 family)
MMRKTLGWVGALALGGAAFLWPQAGQAQFRAPAAGTMPPGYRSSTLPPRYGSSTLPPVPSYAMPVYAMPVYRPTDYTPTAPPQEIPSQQIPPSEAPTAPGPRQVEPPAPDNMAVITARVPEGAELRFDGVKIAGTGPDRQFKTPSLRPGQRYAYTVEARWQENGREVTQSRQLPVYAGANVQLVFPLAPADGAKEPVSQLR